MGDRKINDQRKLSILMTADTVGGVWTYALELIEALEPLGIEVHLATMGRLPSPAQQRQAAAIPNLYLHKSSYKLEWMENPWQEVEEAGKWLLQLEEQLQPDLIHLNNFCHGQLSWKAPVLMVGHSCVLSWWKAVKGEAAPQQYQRYAREVKAGLQAADLVIAPTNSYLQCLKDWYGPLPAKKVIPNSRSHRLFRPSAKEEFILSMGRLWDEAKNIQSLTAVAQKLPWPVKVAGDATHPVNGNISDYPNLQLLGLLSQEEAAQQLNKAAIYVMPAKYEPFGLSVLEAALAGCALVLSNIPSLQENWEGAAIFANPEDPEEIEDKLLFLTKNAATRKEMAEKSLQKAVGFSADNQAFAYAAHYQNLIMERDQRMHIKQNSSKSSYLGKVKV